MVRCASDGNELRDPRGFYNCRRKKTGGMFAGGNSARRVFRGWAAAGAAVIWSIGISGCVPLLVGAAAGAAGITFVRGALVQNLSEDVGKVHKATLAALKDLGLTVTLDKTTANSSRIIAEHKDGQKVQINIEALTGFVSKISIRVGTFGDQDESQMILNAIQKRL